jgi:NADPH-dependent 2,4-dienoyl-CoA reductase/sulfur reductase-like enzyme
VLEALPVPLSRGLGDTMGAACGQLHADHGATLRVNAAVDTYEGTGRVEAVRLANGDRIPADLVVVGVGVVPETGWLDGSGLELRDGVVCDERCAAVGADGVFAAGDVARWFNPLFDEEMRIEHWTNAAEQGDAAARNLAAHLRGEAPAPFAPVPFFWSDQYETKLQFVGRAAPGDEVLVVHGAVEDRRFVALYGRQGRLVGALGFSMPRLLMGYRRLLAERATWDEALEHAKTV